MIEPRHGRTAPRSWWSLFFAVGGYFVILAGLALFGFTIWSSVDYRKATMFERDGVVVDAEIVSKRTVEGDDDTDYYIVFAYEVGERLVKVERSVSSGFYYDWSVGSDAPIRYMPNRPTRMEYYIGESHRKARMTQMIGGIVGLLGLGLLWFAGSKANSAVLARRKGYRTTATIHRFVERKNSGKPTGRGYMIFETGDRKQGQSLDHNINKLRRLGSGSQIVVFVRGEDVWWEGDTGPRTKVPRDFPKVTDS